MKFSKANIKKLIKKANEIGGSIKLLCKEKATIATAAIFDANTNAVIYYDIALAEQSELSEEGMLKPFNTDKYSGKWIEISFDNDVTIISDDNTSEEQISDNIPALNLIFSKEKSIGTIDNPLLFFKTFGGEFPYIFVLCTDKKISFLSFSGDFAKITEIDGKFKEGQLFISLAQLTLINNLFSKSSNFTLGFSDGTLFIDDGNFILAVELSQPMNLPDVNPIMDLFRNIKTKAMITAALSEFSSLIPTKIVKNNLTHICVKHDGVYCNNEKKTSISKTTNFEADIDTQSLKTALSMFKNAPSKDIALAVIDNGKQILYGLSDRQTKIIF